MARDGNHVIHGSPYLRWLGFYLDRNLNFEEHVKRSARKGISVLARLKLLANTLRGISSYNARLLYNACVVPILTYGSVLWYRNSGRKGLVARLEKTQNKGLIWFLGAFRTSPIPAMEHLASIPPINITLAKLTANAATRLHRQPNSSEVARRLGPDYHSYDPSAPHLSGRRAKPTPIGYLASCTAPDTEKLQPYGEPPWSYPHGWGDRLQVVIDPSLGNKGMSKAARTAASKVEIALNSALARTNSILCYSDGSLRTSRGERRVGAAWSIQRNGREVKFGRFGLGPKSEIYDAEMLGMAYAATAVRELAISNAPDHIRFYCDNQAACTSIVNRRPHDAQWASIAFRLVTDELPAALPNLTITVQWFPGHMGLPGNERAGTLAHEATLIDPTPVFGQSLAYAKGRTRVNAKTAWLSLWDAAQKSAHVRLTLPHPPTRRFKRPATEFYPGNTSKVNPDSPHVAPRYPRAVTSRFNQLVLGHCHVGEYYHRFNIDEEIECPCGYDPIQSIRHVLLECRLHSAPRMFLRAASRSLNLNALFGTEKGREAVHLFLARSTAFRP